MVLNLSGGGRWLCVRVPLSLGLCAVCACVFVRGARGVCVPLCCFGVLCVCCVCVWLAGLMTVCGRVRIFLKIAKRALEFALLDSNRDHR